MCASTGLLACWAQTGPTGWISTQMGGRDAQRGSCGAARQPASCARHGCYAAAHLHGVPLPVLRPLPQLCTLQPTASKRRPFLAVTYLACSSVGRQQAPDADATPRFIWEGLGRGLNATACPALPLPTHKAAEVIQAGALVAQGQNSLH